MNCQVDQEEGGDTFPQASLLPVPQDPSFQGGARISRKKSITNRLKQRNTNYKKQINDKGIQTKEYKLQDAINYK